MFHPDAAKEDSDTDVLCLGPRHLVGLLDGFQHCSALLNILVKRCRLNALLPADLRKQNWLRVLHVNLVIILLRKRSTDFAREGRQTEERVRVEAPLHHCPRRSIGVVVDDLDCVAIYTTLLVSAQTGLFLLADASVAQQSLHDISVINFGFTNGHPFFLLYLSEKTGVNFYAGVQFLSL